MLLEKVVVRPHSRQLRPPATADGIGLHIVDQGASHSQQEGRVGGDDELAVVEAGGVLQELQQLRLFGGGKAVFRLVQEVESAVLDAAGEVERRALAIGLLPDIGVQPAFV